MGIRNIVKDGDEILRKTSKSVTVFDEKLHKLIDDMWETLHGADGCGLAAPQVGILKRLAIVELEGRKFELINPEITSASGENSDKEGCLSLPGKFDVVIRPQKITVEYLDRHGKPQKLDAEEYLARACCHEIDHLDGIMYYDRVKKQ